MNLGVAGSSPVGRPIFWRDMYFVYILVCLETGRSYVGQTDNLLRRFRRHREGSTRTTRDKFVRPVVVHWVAYPSRAEAMRRERYYKHGAGCRRKHILIGRTVSVFRPPN